MEYDGYTAFEDSLTGEEIVDLLNENDELKHQVNCLQDRLDDFVPVTHEVTQCHCDLAEQIRENKELKSINQVLESEHGRLQKQLRLVNAKNCELVSDQKELQGLIYQTVVNLIDEKIKEQTYSAEMIEKTIEEDYIVAVNRLTIAVLEDLKRELPIK